MVKELPRKYEPPALAQDPVNPGNQSFRPANNLLRGLQWLLCPCQFGGQLRPPGFDVFGRSCLAVITFAECTDPQFQLVHPILKRFLKRTPPGPSSHSTRISVAVTQCQSCRSLITPSARLASTVHCSKSRVSRLSWD